MRLNDRKECATSLLCSIGERAGQDRTVWPLELKDEERRRWYVYIVDNQPPRRGSHTMFALCKTHHELLYIDWEQIAREEVYVRERTDQYHSRGFWW